MILSLRCGNYHEFSTLIPPLDTPTMCSGIDLHGLKAMTQTAGERKEICFLQLLG